MVLHLYRNNLKNREYAREAPRFLPKLVGAEAAKLKKFSAGVPEDASSSGWGAGGVKSGGCPTQAETDSSSYFSILNFAASIATRIFKSTAKAAFVFGIAIFFFVFQSTFLFAEEEPSYYGISSNPGAVNISIGTGALGDWLRIPEKSGIRLGGLWMADANPILNGVKNDRWTGNNLLILDLAINLHQAVGWKGAFLAADFLQFNGQATNKDAGAAQGYNSITGDPPLNRSELYQLWFRQELFDKKLSLRIGKTAPIYHFNNVSKPVPTENPSVYIPSVSGLIYTPLFVNTTLLGAIGGYYNSVYGIEMSIAPVKEAYLNIGVFDGNLARGVQTGLKGPHFNGYYFSIAEVGYGWSGAKPGIAAVGGWYQSGKLKLEEVEQNGTGGIYLFGSQALWIRKSKGASKGNLSGFYQFGWNQSKILPMDLFFGAGLTGFALVPKRPGDSFGFGLAWSRLNRRIFPRSNEWMVQGYYQAKLYKTLYFQPVLSYIPNPGEDSNRSNVCTMTARLIALF